jgi:hypothetical protein
MTNPFRLAGQVIGARIMHQQQADQKAKKNAPAAAA